jgi:FdhD protein
VEDTAVAFHEREPTVEVDITAWRDALSSHVRDTLAVEEPLEIQLAGCSVAVTMRTPGDDLDLAAGFLFTEGILHGASDIESISHCPSDDPEAEGNIVNVNPADPAKVDPERWRRNFFATSSCGICGKASIDQVRQEAEPINSPAPISPSVLSALDSSLRRKQRTFDLTGGLHAAALFDLGGRLILLREDVGRHNAVDKVIGAMVRQESVPLSSHVLMVSGRASFEVVQKALMAGIPIVAAVSAPSSLAVDLARESGMTLVGFLRDGGFNVYSGAERILDTMTPR